MERADHGRELSPSVKGRVSSAGAGRMIVAPREGRAPDPSDDRDRFVVLRLQDIDDATLRSGVSITVVEALRGPRGRRRMGGRAGSFSGHDGHRSARRAPPLRARCHARGHRPLERWTGRRRRAHRDMVLRGGPLAIVRERRSRSLPGRGREPEARRRHGAPSSVWRCQRGGSRRNHERRHRLRRNESTHWNRVVGRGTRRRGADRGAHRRAEAPASACDDRRRGPVLSRHRQRSGPDPERACARLRGGGDVGDGRAHRLRARAWPPAVRDGVRRRRAAGAFRRAVRRGGLSDATARSGGEGAFRFDALHGPCTLSVSHPDHPTLGIAEPDPTGERHYRFEPGARIELEVVDDEDRPAAHFWYDLDGPSQRRGSDQNPRGRTQIVGLAEGTYTLRVHRAGALDAATKVIVTRGATEHVRVVLTPVGAIHGRSGRGRDPRGGVRLGWHPRGHMPHPGRRKVHPERATWAIRGPGLPRRSRPGWSTARPAANGARRRREHLGESGGSVMLRQGPLACLLFAGAAAPSTFVGKRDRLEIGHTITKSELRSCRSLEMPIDDEYLHVEVRTQRMNRGPLDLRCVGRD